MTDRRLRKRIFKKKSKKKAKSKQIQAREGKDQVKSKSKSHPLEENTTSGAKTAKPKVVLQKIKKTRVKVANRVEITFKLYNLRGPNCQLTLKPSFPPQNPVTTGMSPHTFSTAKPLLSLAKIISSTLLPPQLYKCHVGNPSPFPKHFRWLRLSPKKLKRNQRLGFA
ncbi:hypothetical protein Tco_0643713 [Tanacetum coccineum]